MALFTDRYDIDVTSSGKPIVIPISQYSTDFTWLLYLYSSHGAFALEEGTTARIRGRKPDGNVYTAECVLDTGLNRVAVTGDVQITAVAGDAVFEIVLYKDNKELATKNFIVRVERAAADKDSITSDSKVRELIDIEDNADEIIAAAEAVRVELSQYVSILGNTIVIGGE